MNKKFVATTTAPGAQTLDELRQRLKAKIESLREKRKHNKISGHNQNKEAGADGDANKKRRKLNPKKKTDTAATTSTTATVVGKIID